MKSAIVIIWMISGLLAIPSTMAQEKAIVNSIIADASDLTAATHIQRDLLGRPCALVKFSVLADDVRFSGDTVHVEYHGSEYWVYMPEGTKHLHATSSKFKPLHIFFPEYDISELKGQQTYTVDVSIPSKRPQGAALLMTVIPADSRVFVDGREIEVSDGVATTYCRAGRHAYRVEAQGYKTSEGKFSIADRKNFKTTVKLKSIANLRVQPFRGPTGQVGFRDQNNKTVVKPEFDKVIPAGTVFWVTKNGKYGMIDQQGERKAQCTFDNVLASRIDGLFIVSQDGKYGIMNANGWLTVPCMLDKVSTTSAEPMVGIMDGQFGLIDASGELVIPCENEEITDFFDGLAGIKRDGKCGFINKNGEIVIPMIYDGVSHFSGGISRVTHNGRVYFIDKSGNEVDMTAAPAPAE